MSQEYPTYRNAPVDNFTDLPMDDPIGTVRLVRADGKLYQTVNDSILQSQRWAVNGATQTVLGNE